MCFIQELLYGLPCQVIIGQVYQHQVVIRSAGYDFNIPCHQPLAKSLGIVHNPFLVCFELLT